MNRVVANPPVGEVVEARPQVPPWLLALFTLGGTLAMHKQPLPLLFTLEPF